MALCHLTNKSSFILSFPADSEIIKLVLDSNTSNRGFGILVRKYQKQIYWHIRRLVLNHEDTDDLVQEVFVKIWKNLKNFRSDSKLFTWIYRIATNEALSHLKKKKNRYFFSFSDYQHKITESLEDDNYFKGDEIQKKLQYAISKLPDKQRAVFNMKYYEDVKYEDMSEIFQTSVGALKASYHIAVKKIEEFVIEH